MKKLLIAITVTALVASLSFTSAYAGSSRRHTVEGIVLGTILGVTIGSQLNNDSKVYVNHTYRDRNDNRGYGGWDRRDNGFSNHYPRNRFNDRWNSPERHHSKHNRGHWIEKKVWVPPVYKEIRNDRHRSSYRGHRDSGHDGRILIRDGYCRTDRIWVSRY